MTEGAAASIEAKLAELSARVDSVAAERDEYRKLYLQTLELCRKLELGMIGSKRRVEMEAGTSKIPGIDCPTRGAFVCGDRHGCNVVSHQHSTGA